MGRAILPQAKLRPHDAVVVAIHLGPKGEKVPEVARTMLPSFIVRVRPLLP
jgi:hypothetical protein